MLSKKKVLIGLYLLGVACVCLLLLSMLIGGNKIINPDAMLPFTYLERGRILLGLGAIPMFIVSCFLFHQTFSKMRLFIWLPALITGCCFVYECTILAMGFFNSFIFIPIRSLL